MKEKKYNQPKITINKIYTKVGDSGQTRIIGGHKVYKNDIRIKSFGEVDELNVSIANCCVLIEKYIKKDIFKKLQKELYRIQHELFNLGNMIATLPEDYTPNMPVITENDIDFLENKIDSYNSKLSPLSSFVLAGGSELNVRFHIARTICRRCEVTVVALSKSESINSLIVSYLNRLSDLLFVLARWSNHILKKNEFIWNPNFKG